MKTSTNASTTSSIVVTASGSSTLSSTSSSLFGGYEAAYSGDTQSIMLSGLAGYQDFTLYLYSQGGTTQTGRPTTFTLASGNGGATASTVNTSASSGFVLGQNYVVLTGETSSTGTVSLSYVTETGNGTEADVNGLQLELGAVVPEPSTWAMLQGGLGLLFSFRRLRRFHV